MNLSGHGITAPLPHAWEGAIVTQPPIDLRQSAVHGLAVEDDGATSDGRATAPAVPETRTLASLPVIHLANFPLPPARGDFGSGAVEIMGAADVFVALVEYGPENIGTPLFVRKGLPQGLVLTDFHPLALQRPLPGQAGYQEFFTAAGRPFCVYVVLGGTSSARRTLAAVNTILAGLEIGPRA